MLSSMNGRKLVVIGAGSAYTPEIIDEIIHRNDRLNIREIALVDIPAGSGRAEIILGMAERMLKKAGVDCRVELTLDRRAALPGADFVISQIRVGGWQARAEDEHIGLQLGLIGQETTGCGGFMNAMRTIPEALAIAKDIAELCPDAILLNFTNPSGIVTEALLRYTPVYTIGLCNVPINMQADAAAALGLGFEEVRCVFGGLNHLSFMLSAESHGSSVYELLLHQLSTDPTTMKNIPKVAGTDRLIHTLGLIPSPYLQYFYFEPEMLEKELDELAKSGTTRGEQVEKINQELFRIYAQKETDEKPSRLSERGGSLYSRAAMDILEATLGEEPKELTINTLNEGAIEELHDYAGVELTCRVSRHGVQRIKIGRLPSKIAGLVKQVKCYENLTVEAAVLGSKKLALQALNCNPLVHGFTNAEKVIAAMETRKTCPVIWKEA